MINGKFHQKLHLFEIYIFGKIINVFSVTVDQMNVLLLNKSINLFKQNNNLVDHKPFNSSVCLV